MEETNRELEQAIERSDAEWDGAHVRGVVTPNMDKMAQLKDGWAEGVGLTQRHGRHPEPHIHPEIRTLTKLYKSEELHVFRRGRSYNRSAEDVDTFSRGVENLSNGKLQQWIDFTTRARKRKTEHADHEADTSEEDIEMTSENVLDSLDNVFGAEDEDEGEIVLTRGNIAMRDGELVVEFGTDDA